jgi:hypothetical protein
MKKGCFIKFIVFLTIFVAAAIYIVQTKLDDWVLKPGKGIIKEVFNNSWEKDMVHVKPSAEKDSLKILITKYIDDISSADISDDKMEKIKNTIIISAADSIIDKNELKNLRNLFRVNNERSKKN